MIKKALKIRKGKTFDFVLRWEDEELVYVPISAIPAAAPARITTSVPHQLPPVWRGCVVSAGGMKEINTTAVPLVPDTHFQRLTTIDASTVEFNGINAAGFTPYTSGGYLVFNRPKSFVGFTSNLVIRDKDTGAELVRLTETTGIELDATNKVMTATFAAADTAAYTWEAGSYEWEILSNDATPKVSLLAYGDITALADGT